MNVDKRLVDIKDCLYRVAVKAVIINDKKVLLVIDERDDLWSFPGGGIDYGESVKDALLRELGEEVGLSEGDIKSDFKTEFISIGHEKAGIPRANIFVFVEVEADQVKSTKEVQQYKWFSLDEIIGMRLDPSTGNIKELLSNIKNRIG